MLSLKIIATKIHINVFKHWDAWVLYHVNTIDPLLYTYYMPDILEDLRDIFLLHKMIFVGVSKLNSKENHYAPLLLYQTESQVWFWINLYLKSQIIIARKNQDQCFN